MTPLYTKLPGSGNRGGSIIPKSRGRLFEGPDHVLCVDSEGGYVETYKRFYYRDIQAFILRKTNRQEVTAVIAGLTLTGLVLLLLLSDSTIARVTFGAFAVIPVVTLLINWALGPTCFCHVKTAVQVEELPSLGRIRRARSVIDRLSVRILDAQSGTQGVVTDEQE